MAAQLARTGAVCVETGGPQIGSPELAGRSWGFPGILCPRTAGKMQMGVASKKTPPRFGAPFSARKAVLAGSERAPHAI